MDRCDGCFVEAGSALMGKGCGAGSIDRNFDELGTCVCVETVQLMLCDVYLQPMDGLQQRADTPHFIPDSMVYLPTSPGNIYLDENMRHVPSRFRSHGQYVSGHTGQDPCLMGCHVITSNFLDRSESRFVYADT